MGVVWQAYDERLRRAVAVKQLRLEPGLDPVEADEARERAMREGRIAARLHHPNAVSVFDVVDEDDAPWLVMEYVPSRSLAQEMHDRRVLQPEEVGRIGAQVAHALVAAHQAGIVHRDIKPANILLGEDGAVKITDFGISRATGDVAVTKTGLIAGTPAYLAPEVAYGRNPEAPADVFSLGSTLYAAVEGEPPFGLSENTLGLLHAVAAGRIIPPQQAGILTDVLVHLLNADPEGRPTSVTAARWLDQVARGIRPDIAAGPDTLSGMGPTAVVGGMAPTALSSGRTRAVTTVGAYGTPGTNRGTSPVRPGGARPGDLDRSRGNRRTMVFAGLGIAAVAVVAAIIMLSGVFNSHNSPTTQPISNTSGPTEPDYQPLTPNNGSPVTVDTNIPRHTRTTAPTKTTTTAPTTTMTTTTTVPPTTTTTVPPTTAPTTTQAPTTTDGGGGGGNGGGNDVNHKQQS